MIQKGRFCNMKKKEKNVSEYITETLLEILTEKTLNEISISELTDKANVSRVSFYRNFNSKNEIIEKYLYTITNNFINEYDISYLNTELQEYITILFNHLYQFKDFAIVLNNNNMLHLIKNQFDRIFESKYKKTLEPYQLYFISGGLYNIYYHWLINGCPETPQELSNKLTDLLLK